MRFGTALVLLVIIGTWSLAAHASYEPGTQGPFAPDYVVEQPPAMTTIADSPWQVVYLNFDGATLKLGQSDARTNSTGLILGSSLNYPGKDWSKLGGEDVGKKIVVDQLKKIYMKYAIKFVTERPSSGNYTMAMIGGDGTGCKQGGAGTIGIAPLDCKNASKNDVVLIFADKGSIATSGKQVALVIAHELGHSFGLEHVTTQKDIMYPALNGETCCWTKSSLSGGSTCGRSEQDAEKVLEDNLGRGKQDKIAPKIWFMRPGDGAVLPPDFSFEIAAADDLGVRRVVIEVDGKQKLALDDPPFTSVLRSTADGEHTIKAIAYDWIDNKAEAQVTVTVRSKCAHDGSCHGGTAGIGGGCTTGSECISGICAVKDGAGECVDLCDPEAEDPICPAGLTCQETGAQGACMPGDGFTLDMGAVEEGGCRVATDSPTRILGWLPLLAALALLALARRREPRT